MARDWPKKIKTNKITFNIDNVKEMLEGIEGLGELKLEVGVLRNKKLQEIAIYQEYGTFRGSGTGKVQHIPARSFIRSTEKEAAKDLIPEMQVDLVGFVLRRRKLFPSGKEVKKYALANLNALGEKMKLVMKQKILNHIPPRLKPSTVAGKKRAGYPLPTTPLIATGDMWQSIDYRVREHGRFAAKEQ